MLSLLPRIVVLLALGGCASDPAAFPSLAARDIERIDPAADPVVAPQARPAASPEALAAAAAAVAAAEKGEAGFRSLLAESAPVLRAAAGATAGDERWLKAQLALSRLQTARLATADALARLDEQRAGGAPEVESAWARVSTLDAGQAASVAELQALLANS